MATITKEFAQDIIKGHGYGVAPSAVEALARIALASLEAEPYGYTDGDRFGMVHEPRHADRLMKPRPLYTALPAPVVPPEQSWEELCRQNPDMIRAFNIMKMKRSPSTDAFTNEMRAQGVEMFANSLRIKGDDQFFDELADATADIADLFAQKLREDGDA
ncbi:hypothetical protein [Edwardsiella phage MSW-3]|uniref:Uncharacterized protein n=1 Tax=Edwardsiella phage MSW-3 TaxID=1264700 RepID=L0MYG0_9CAUD|nr:hypothetical protein G428_gp20 [Edwardsiella phage MSW-3]BAM68841.1 hypothetical protein [Edwardsiella phage MSW-3]